MKQILYALVHGSRFVLVCLCLRRMIFKILPVIAGWQETLYSTVVINSIGIRLTT